MDFVSVDEDLWERCRSSRIRHLGGLEGQEQIRLLFSETARKSETLELKPRQRVRTRMNDGAMMADELD